MTEAGATVAKPKGRSARFVISVLLLLLALGAFGYAFYYLDGVDTLTGLFGGSTSNLAPSPAPSATATASPGAPALPPGVDPLFAKRVYREQIESRENITKLVEGEVDFFTMGKASAEATESIVDIEATFKDGTSAPGIMAFNRFGGNWYLAYAAGRRDPQTGGLAESVATDTDENSPEHLDETRRSEVDTAVVNTMMAEQARSQAVLGNLAAGKCSRLTIDAVVKGRGTATIDVTLVDAGAPVKAQVVCISKQIGGKTYWFITSYKRT